ncbi:MAG: DUF3791 domain-containing protein [Victivallales bacterium]|nr:DUF3791 domain-containing protein [Victivallales bacterium]
MKKSKVPDAPSGDKPIELDEVLFMQTRIFSMFCQRHPSILPSEMDGIFKSCGIWEFIRDGYDGLHTEGDEAVFQEIQEILSSRGVKL